MILGKEKILDDIVKVAGGTISVFSGFQTEVREEIKSHIDELALKMDLVPRKDFEDLQSILAEARQEQERLKKRLDDLESQIKNKK